MEDASQCAQKVAPGGRHLSEYPERAPAPASLPKSLFALFWWLPACPAEAGCFCETYFSGMMGPRDGTLDSTASRAIFQEETSLARDKRLPRSALRVETQGSRPCWQGRPLNAAHRLPKLPCCMRMRVIPESCRWWWPSICSPAAGSLRVEPPFPPSGRTSLC